MPLIGLWIQRFDQYGNKIIGKTKTILLEFYITFVVRYNNNYQKRFKLTYRSLFSLKFQR